MIATVRPVFKLSNIRPHPTFCPCAIDDRTFNRFNGDRVVDDVQRARCLARCRADSSGELGEVIRGVKHLNRLPPSIPVHQIVPIWNNIIHGASLMAERDAAVHASCALEGQLLVRQATGELAPVGYSFSDILALSRWLAWKIKKASDLTHPDNSPTHENATSVGGHFSCPSSDVLSSRIFVSALR